MATTSKMTRSLRYQVTLGIVDVGTTDPTHPFQGTGRAGYFR
jgi:hypothetical protein